MNRDEGNGLERWLIVLVAAHALGVGCLLAFFPRAAVEFAGWGPVAPAFFPRQAGVFHVVLAFGYLLEHFRYRGIALLLTAKGVACVFLLLMTAAGGVPWAVPFSGIADGLMGAAVLYARRRTQKSDGTAAQVGRESPSSG